MMERGGSWGDGRKIYRCQGASPKGDDLRRRWEASLLCWDDKDDTLPLYVTGSTRQAFPHPPQALLVRVGGLSFMLVRIGRGSVHRRCVLQDRRSYGVSASAMVEGGGWCASSASMARDLCPGRRRGRDAATRVHDPYARHPLVPSQSAIHAPGISKTMQIPLQACRRPRRPRQAAGGVVWRRGFLARKGWVVVLALGIEGEEHRRGGDVGRRRRRRIVGTVQHLQSGAGTSDTRALRKWLAWGFYQEDLKIYHCQHGLFGIYEETKIVVK